MSFRLLGLEEVHTGGGCMALMLPLADQSYVLVTDEDGMRIPANDAPSVLCGIYDAQGETLWCGDVKADELVGWLQEQAEVHAK